MTTKQELIDGLSMVLREGQRVTATFGPADWQRKVLDEGGTWTRKQAYAHITATAEITPAFAPNLAGQAAGGDAAAGLDINALNAQLVGAKDAMTPDELMTAFTAGFTNVIAFVKGLPDETLQQQTKFGELEGNVADIMDGILVLHPMAHIYAAGGSPLG